MAVSGATPGLRVHKLSPGLKRTLGVVMHRDKPVSKALLRVMEALRAQAAAQAEG